MGATHKYDLTSDVTHLLVGEVNTPKYKFVARERTDVTVLKPDWIDAVRQSWMQGEDIDIRVLEEKYRCPTFMGLSLCITGFDDMAFRNCIQDTAVVHGADFKKDLTKSVTHLIARNTEGQKYKFATQWNIKVVTINWFRDSIERGMVLEETLYHPLLPSEQQGMGAWKRSVSTSKGKISHKDDAINPRPRKLRRIASTKLMDQNEGIWGDIVGAGYFDPPEVSDPQNEDNATVAKSAPVLQEAKSFASESTFADALDQRQIVAVAPTISQPNGILRGCYFFIFGFSEKQSKVLRYHLQSNGAQLVGSISEFASQDIPKRGNGLYTIVPYKTHRRDIPSTDDLAFDCEVVTDMWLERCLDAKTLVSVESHVACTPVPKFPIPEFQNMKICSTGVARIDLLHLSKLVDLLGAQYDEYLTPKASVLICNDPKSASREKLRHTCEWGVPAVSVDWLWMSIQSGEKKPFEPYLIKMSSSQAPRPSKEPTTISTHASSSMGSCQLRNSEQPDCETSLNDQHASSDLLLPDKASASQRNGKLTSNNASKMSNEDPKRSHLDLPSNSPTPAKDQPQYSSVDETSPKNTSNPVSPSALDRAVSGLLKQARAANYGAHSDMSAGENDQPRSRRRKPLLGRAQTNPTNRTGDQPAISRASSIDTLNEDGCGSAIESDGNLLSRGNSRSGRSFSCLLNGGRVEFEEDPLVHRKSNEPDGDEALPMTQLNYEDPDAVAMRAKILRQAGKTPSKELPNKQALVLGEVKELEDVGWGTRRRTRKATKTVTGDFL